MLRPRLVRLAAPLVLAAATACNMHQVDLTVQAPITMQEEPTGYEAALVTRVIDGDTIEVEIQEVVPGPGAGNTVPDNGYDVRLTGIDTPESVKPGSPVECFGKEASAALKALLDGHEVRLVKDVEDTDRYDRLLRYVYMGEEMANARMVANGYASAYTYPPNVRHSELFVRLQAEARDNNRGLWHPDACNGDTETQ
ncbi:MAG TPA: thermonuclease family protein [Actinomycetota bacterium]|nr:thermonuclease family protein [Actinomycetota bacterium]